MQIEDLIKFVGFTHEIQKIKRANMVPGANAHETDTEHQYQMALAAWYLIEHLQLKLDIHRAVELALIHDIPEVYSGDTSVYATKKHLSTKAEREHAAIAKLKDTWPGFSSLHASIAEYEARETPEAKFIYALDKLLPIINNYADGGRAWKNQSVTYEHMKAVKAGKIDQDPTINALYLKLLPILERTPGLFVEASKK